MKTVDIKTKKYGVIKVKAGYDEAGNKRLFPVDCATLEEWRANNSLVPPWIIPDDLSDHDHWMPAFNESENNQG